MYVTIEHALYDCSCRGKTTLHARHDDKDMNEDQHDEDMNEDEVHDAAWHDKDEELRWRWWIYCGPNSRKILCLPVRQDLCLTTEDPPRTSRTFPFNYGLPNEPYCGRDQIPLGRPAVCYIQRGWSLNKISCPQCGGTKILTQYIPSPELFAQELPRPKHDDERYTKSEAAIVVLGRTAPQTAQRKEIKKKIVDEGFAPSISALDRVIDPLQRGEVIDDGHFPTKKRGREEDLAEKKDQQSQLRLKFVRPTISPFEVGCTNDNCNVCCSGWASSFFLPVALVPLEKLRELTGPQFISFKDLAAAKELKERMSNPPTVSREFLDRGRDLTHNTEPCGGFDSDCDCSCSSSGSVFHSGPAKRRAYFSITQFRSCFGLPDANKKNKKIFDKEWSHLINYIRTTMSLQGVPVKCVRHGGRPPFEQGFQYKEFGCCHDGSCTFEFRVVRDYFGFYIPSDDFDFFFGFQHTCCMSNAVGIL